MARVVGKVIRVRTLDLLRADRDIVSMASATGVPHEVSVNRTQASFFRNAKEHDIALSIEIDRSNVATDIRVPIPAKILRSREVSTGDDLEVELEISHARHWLKKSSSSFDRLKHIVEAYVTSGRPALVTVDDANFILDIHSHAELFALQFLREAPTARALRTPATPISPAIAAAEFKKVSTASCVAVQPSSTCIPFGFPDDGCWARAHESCRRMLVDGLDVRKAWIYGDLTVRTANHPNCSVRWRWHVAPLLTLNYPAGDQKYIADPSMFEEPVPLTVWISAQGDPTAMVAITGPEAYYRSSSGGISEDPSYQATANILARYRLDLQRRALQLGVPPYAACAVYAPV